MPSRLAGQRSAYLQSAAHQPVDWHPWGDEAFARARREGKPVLLDIGAVWCHWCHVMDGESYEDAVIAAQLNRDWICIKVDRDERPDVDARYQQAVQAMTGQGGWPLTAFLTSDGEVFFGGTYFPPDGKYGRPGFATVLERLAATFRNEPGKVRDQVTALTRHLDEEADRAQPGTIEPEQLRRAADLFARAFDFRYGGFGTEPKFPHPRALEFLLVRSVESGEAWQREMVDRTLDAMARGGMHDQVGGGFHRYAIDARWIIPHFEKMLYDNAELLRVYVAAAATAPEHARERYRSVVTGIVEWVTTTMADPAGGYYASQDADVGLDDDGDYFTWTVDELREAVAPEEAAVLERRFGLGGRGAMRHDPARHVLWVAEEPDAIAAGLDLPTAEVPAALERGRAALLAARARRPAPFVDTTLYTGWNAMMASAMLAAAALLDRNDLDRHALLTLDRFHREADDGAGGVRHAVGGTVGSMLDDQVQLAHADIDAFESTGDRTWLDRSLALAEHAWEEFRGDDGLLLDRSPDNGPGFLARPVRPIADTPTPSPTGVAAITFARLAAHTGDERWHERLRGLLEAVGGGLADLSLHGATLLLAADWYLLPATHVVVVAADPDEQRAMARAARATWRPRKVITVLGPEAPRTTLPPAVRAAADGAEPRAYVCVGPQCTPPVNTAGALREALQAL